MHLNTPLGLLTVTFKQSERLLQKLNIYMEFPVIVSLLARFCPVPRFWVCVPPGLVLDSRILVGPF